MFRPRLDKNYIKTTNEGLIYPVYINSRCITEIVKFCKDTYPKEALAFLLGVKSVYKGDKKTEYTRVVDWVTGSVDSTHISANFTSEGLQQANAFLDDKFGKDREKNPALPKIIGIVHSHPFGFEPHFSSVDLDSFLNFPYDSAGNVFILIDPVPNNPYFKVFKIIIGENNEKLLQHVPWIEYSSIKSEFNQSADNFGLNEQIAEEKHLEEQDPYTPPKIEDLGPKKNSKKKNDVRDFFS